MTAKSSGPALRLVGGRKPARKAKPSPAPAAPAPVTLESRAQAFVARSRSDATRRAYASDWAHFSAWCEARDVPALPASSETVVLYLTAFSDTLKPATLSRRLVSISQIHQDAGQEPPTRAVIVRRAFSGIRREVGTEQTQKAPLVAADVRRVVELLPDSLLGLRDRALLLVGFAGAFRRSELIAVNVADIMPCPDGLIVRVRKSKTDQEGKGQRKAIPFGKNAATCPVRAYRAWIAASGIKSGPVFRYVDRFGNVAKGRLSGWGAAKVIKRAAEAAGLDPAQYAGHSLRAGLVTSAVQQGKPTHKIMAQTGHTSEKMVQRYIRDRDAFKDNAADGIGL